ncbi:MAG: DUF4340 domain-containing protein [Verrucomicrobiota bacterium]
MRWKLTIILLLLNLAAFAYIYYLENREDPRQTMRESSSLVLPSPSNIDQVTLTATNDGKVFSRVLEQTREGWQLTEPVKWPANENAVQNILNQLKFLEQETSFPMSDIEKSGQSLKQFGLDPARFELRLRERDGKETKLEIGAPTQMGNRLYVLAPSGDKVIVVGDQLLTAIALPLSDLRSQRIFNIPVFELESLTVQTTGQRIRLVKGNDGWSFETPVPAKADDDLVQNALALVVGQRAVRLLEPGSITPELAGLTTPALRVTIGGHNNRQTLLLGEKVPDLPEGTPEQFYARLDNGEDDATIFTVLASPFEWLTRAQEELRERRILRFDPTKVSALEINRAGKNLTLQTLEASGTNNPGAWQSVAAVPGGEVQTEVVATQLVERLIANLNRLEAVAFVSDAPAPSDLENWGFTDPVAKVTIRANNELTLILGNNISSADLTNPPIWANPRNIYAKTADKPYVYAVDLSILGALRADPLAYRSRKLSTLPKGARIQSLKITDLEANKVLLDETIDPQTQTWPTALPTDNVDRSEILSVIDTLKDFQVKDYLLPRFEALPNLPWKYRLDAQIILPGGDGSSEKYEYFFSVRDGIRQVGGSPRENVTFLLKQPLIDALFPLTLPKSPPSVPNSPKEVENTEVSTDDSQPANAPKPQPSPQP